MKILFKELWFLFVFVAVFKLAGSVSYLDSGAYPLLQSVTFLLSKLFVWSATAYVYCYLFEQLYEFSADKLSALKKPGRLQSVFVYVLLQLLVSLSNSLIYKLLLLNYPSSAVFVSLILRGLCFYVYVYFALRFLGLRSSFKPQTTTSSFFIFGFLLLISRSNALVNITTIDLFKLIWALLASLAELSLLSVLALMFLEQTYLKKSESIKQITIIKVLPGGFTSSLLALFRGNYAPIFSVLSARTPDDWKVQIHNMRPWHSWHVPKAGLVAISCCTSNAYRAYRIAKQCRAQGLKVIMGGPHVTYNAQEALAYCDAVVVGEVESLWTGICQDYLQGKLRDIYEGGAESDFIGKTHQELLGISPTLSQDFVEATRGCKYGCEFCSIPVLSSNKLRYQKIENLITQLKHIRRKHKTVNFIDNNVFSNKDYAEQLFKAITPLKMKWAAGTSIDLGAHDDSLTLAKASGLKYVLIGYEIAAKSKTRDVSAKFVYIDKYLEYSKNIKKHGIKIKASFVYGFDGDNWKYLFKVFDLFRRIRPENGSATILTPLPGTALYKRYLASDRILNLNWKKYDLRHRVFVVVDQSVTALMSQYCLARYGSFFLFSSNGPVLGLVLLSAVILLLRVLS